MKYRKKPVVIDAVQYDGNFRSLDCFSINEVSHFIVSKDSEGNQCIKIPTLEGEMIASVGDFIIRGVQGEYYPCKEDIFHQTYELVVEPSTYQPYSPPVNFESNGTGKVPFHTICGCTTCGCTMGSRMVDPRFSSIGVGSVTTNTSTSDIK